jgi:hypothetical protein
MNHSYINPQENRMFESKYRVVSIGIAAENKALDTHILPVVPIEMFPLVNGEVMESLEEVDVSGLNQKDIEYTVKIKTTSTLTCEWMPHGSNRVTSPDVRRGERLLIWQYADSDKYYWSPMGMDDDLRRLETVIYAWSATPEIDADLNLTENMYSLEVSTHGKHLTLHTTRADGEPFEYTMQLNTEAGIFFLTDQDGNSIQLDSANRVIKSKNSDESEITINKTKIYAYAKDEIKAKTDDYMEATAGGDITAVAGGSMHVTVDGDFNQHVKGNYNLKVDGAENKSVGAAGVHQYGGAMSVLAGGPVALDGTGVDMMSGLAGPASPAAPAGPKGGGGETPPPPEPEEPEEPSDPDELPEEYSLENTEEIRAKAGRHAALDGPSEIDKTPTEYPEDTKPSAFTGDAKTVSDRENTEKPSGFISCTTQVGSSIDYDLLLGLTDITIGLLSTQAVFSHNVVAQGGLSTQEIVCNMQGLAEKILQPLTDEFGGFDINSGFRKGSGTSQHNKGQAVDIQNPSWSLDKYTEVAEWIADNLPCDQLILEHGNSIWIHVSFDATKTTQRGQLLTMLNGNYEPGLKNYYA